MRDPKRIPKILKRLQDIWEKNPDLRLAQLIGNVYREMPYHKEDDKFLLEIESIYKDEKE